MTGYTQSVNAHYTPGDLEDAILAALRAAGKDPEALNPDDLLPFDQLHTGGPQATLELATLAALRPGMTVLDVGGGIGGAARILASRAGCTVTVLDLTDEFCRAGERLTARMGLGDRVTFRQGNALDMPFADGSFDVVWTQHSSMNIPDKGQLYAEIYRVLRPQGQLALHDIMAGPVQPIHFPAPWARDAAISFLLPPEQVRALLADAGFREVAWVDGSEAAIAWFAERAKAGGTPAPLGQQAVMGPDFGTMLANQQRNYEERRTVVIQAVLVRPS